MRRPIDQIASQIDCLAENLAALDGGIEIAAPVATICTPAKGWRARSVRKRSCPRDPTIPQAVADATKSAGETAPIASAGTAIAIRVSCLSEIARLAVISALSSRAAVRSLADPRPTNRIRLAPMPVTPRNGNVDASLPVKSPKALSRAMIPPKALIELDQRAGHVSRFNDGNDQPIGFDLRPWFVGSANLHRVRYPSRVNRIQGV